MLSPVVSSLLSLPWSLLSNDEEKGSKLQMLALSIIGGIGCNLLIKNALPIKSFIGCWLQPAPKKDDFDPNCLRDPMFLFLESQHVGDDVGVTRYESSGNHTVFSLDKYPYVFKVVGGRELPDRLQNTEKAQHLLKNSAYLAVPWARSENVGLSSPILIEEKLPVSPGDNLRQIEIYMRYGDQLTPHMLELVDFISKTRWSDVEPRNLPAFKTKEGELKIGMVDLETFSDEITFGLLGNSYLGRTGLLKCCVTHDQALKVYNKIKEVLTKKGTWQDHEINANMVLEEVKNSISERERLSKAYEQKGIDIGSLFDNIDLKSLFKDCPFGAEQKKVLENYAHTLLNHKTYGIKACLKKNQGKYDDDLSIRKVFIPDFKIEVGAHQHADGTPFSIDPDGPILALDYILKRFEEEEIIQKKISSNGHGVWLQV